MQCFPTAFSLIILFPNVLGQNAYFDSDFETALPFPNASVTLNASWIKQREDLNTEYLRSLDPDRLLHNFRVNAQSGEPVEVQRVPLNRKTVYLKAVCDFRDLADVADFYYSLNGKTWIQIGTQLNMEYSMPHFMGYRFGLFNYATQNTGGYVDFDWFRTGMAEFGD